jgi:hypothetical protein
VGGQTSSEAFFGEIGDPCNWRFGSKNNLNTSANGRSFNFIVNGTVFLVQQLWNPDFGGRCEMHVMKKWDLKPVPVTTSPPIADSSSSAVLFDSSSSSSSSTTDIAPLTSVRVFEPTTNVSGALNINVVASFSSAAAGAPRLLFNLNGLTATLRFGIADSPDVLFFNNAYNISSNCHTTVLLTSTSSYYSSWPVDTVANVTIPVSWQGLVEAPLVDGVPMQLDETAEDMLPQMCQMLRISKGLPVFVGGDNVNATDLWVGSIGKVSLTHGAQ